MGVKGGIVAALASGLLALAPTGAMADAVQDASCQGPGTSNEVVQGTQRVAQTFTAGITGKLTAAEIVVTKNAPDPPGDYQVRLAPVDASGAPTNDVLATAVIPFASVPPGSINLPVTGTFSPAGSVVAGTSYALVVTRPPAGPNGLRLEGQGPAAGCSGQLWLSASQTDPFTQVAGFFLTYRTFVDRPPTASINKHPKSKSKSTSAKFKFSADEGNVSFQCQLDKSKAKACNSPAKFKNLKPGKHRFLVTATDTAGSVSPPVAFKWKVQSP